MNYKTQVFFNIENDHICTRMEHVAHVESVSHTIAKCLGLNDELTKAIAMGHAPFGHQGLMYNINGGGKRIKYLRNKKGILQE